MGKQTTHDKLMHTLALYVDSGLQAEAAEALGVTTYTIWNRLAVLEAQHGQLLLRNGRGHRTSKLNAYGKQLLQKWKEGA